MPTTVLRAPPGFLDLATASFTIRRFHCYSYVCTIILWIHLKLSVKFKQWSSEWSWNRFSLWRGYLWWWHQRNTWGWTRVCYSSTSLGFGWPCFGKITSYLAKLDYTNHFWTLFDLRIFIFDLFGPYWSILFGKLVLVIILVKKILLNQVIFEKKIVVFCF